MSSKKRKFRMRHPKDEADLNRVVEEVTASEHAHEHHVHAHEHEYGVEELLSAMATSLHVLEHEIEDLKIRVRIIESKIDQLFDTLNDIKDKIASAK